MTQKHKDLIIQWANGAKIEYYSRMQEEWRPINYPNWDPDVEYRLALEVPEGFTRYTDRDRPVEDDTPVVVYFNHGVVSESICPADMWAWGYDPKASADFQIIGYKALPKPPEGYKLHKNNAVPLTGGKPVTVFFASGVEYDIPREADQWNWGYDPLDPPDGQIIAYKVVDVLPDGFIKNSTKTCPVDPRTIVQVVYYNDGISEPDYANTWHWDSKVIKGYKVLASSDYTLIKSFNYKELAGSDSLYELVDISGYILSPLKGTNIHWNSPHIIAFRKIINIPDGFTPHTEPYKCPVSDELIVEVLYDNGNKKTAQAFCFNWTRAIAAYRVVETKYLWANANDIVTPCLLTESEAKQLGYNKRLDWSKTE